MVDAIERTAGYLRIGELSRRVGVAPALLRAWQSRYGILAPARSPGGFRLYDADDERRVRAMLANLDKGYPASEAARLALAGGTPADGENRSSDLALGVRDLRESLDDYDDARANRALDRLFATFSMETVLADVVLPYLRDLGDRWERGEASIAQEHFASNIVRGRLLGLARGWGQGAGPRAVLACAPGELHDLGLVVFGIALRARGWRVTFLGVDTPIETLIDVAGTLRPSVVVVTATTSARLAGPAAALRTLADDFAVAVAGRGAIAETADAVGAPLLPRAPIAAAEAVALGGVARGPRPPRA